MRGLMLILKQLKTKKTILTCSMAGEEREYKKHDEDEKWARSQTALESTDHMARLTLDGVRQTGLGLLPSRLGRQDNADSAICLACVDSEWVRQSSPNTCTGPHFSPSPAGQILSTGHLFLSLSSFCHLSFQPAFGGLDPGMPTLRRAFFEKEMGGRFCVCAHCVCVWDSSMNLLGLLSLSYHSSVWQKSQWKTLSRVTFKFSLLQ